MRKITLFLKLLLFIPLLLLVIPFDGVIFALANSCASCSSFGQYLGSSFSLFNSLWLSVTALFLFLTRKK